MPSTRRPLLPILTVVLLLFGLTGTVRAEESITPQDLAGTWTWHHSSGGIAGTIVEPGVDQWIQLEFSEDFKLRVVRNGEPRTGTYELADLPSGGQEIRLLLDEPFPPEFPALSLDMDVALSLGELRLAEPCCDFWSHTFVFDSSGLLPVLRTSFSEVKDRWGDAGR